MTRTRPWVSARPTRYHDARTRPETAAMVRPSFKGRLPSAARAGALARARRPRSFSFLPGVSPVPTLAHLARVTPPPHASSPLRLFDEALTLTLMLRVGMSALSAELVPKARLAHQHRRPLRPRIAPATRALPSSPRAPPSSPFVSPRRSTDVRFCHRCRCAPPRLRCLTSRSATAEGTKLNQGAAIPAPGLALALALGCRLLRGSGGGIGYRLRRAPWAWLWGRAGPQEVKLKLTLRVDSGLERGWVDYRLGRDTNTNKWARTHARTEPSRGRLRAQEADASILLQRIISHNQTNDFIDARRFENRYSIRGNGVQYAFICIRDDMSAHCNCRLLPFFLRGCLDPNHDTPVELLLTSLLGIIKYVWHILHTTWTEAERNLFVIRLQSTNINELTIPPIRAAYMMQYRNGLIGKHLYFKTLMQTMVFHMHGLVSPELFRLVKAVSALGSVLWVHEIDNVKEYTVFDNDILSTVTHDNDTGTFNHFNRECFGRIWRHDPAKIIFKVKLHLLTHIVEDVIRIGPAIRNSTEIFECFNAIFRLCSILSNHQAPSHDIAQKFASMDRLKHILSSGFWKQGNEWRQAAPNVRDVLQTMPIIRRHLGWVPLKKVLNGAMCFTSKEKSPAIRWKDTQSASASNALANCRSVYWRCALALTAQSGDICSLKALKFVSQNVLIIRRVLELLTPVSGAPDVPTGLVTLENFLVSKELHPDYDMPVLRWPAELDLRIIMVLSDSLLFHFSVRHDCRLADCQPTAFRRVVQERQETSQTAPLIAHADDNHFCINMAAIHIQHIPRPIYLDRKADHYGIATHLQVSQTMKRARTQEKRKATLAAKVAKKGLVEEIGAEDDGGEDSEEDDSLAVPQKRMRIKRTQ
ncbi:hypothetical protein B0H13DRAFT_2284179 [Mycena leptocephala]|nr:hypothetical protein B0H13DRAFT_2284179 [Mycena leptocephala]